jgi:hypothetical protein
VCRDRLVLEHGIPAGQVRVVLNFVDLRRFPPRGPLPARPQRALVFSNYMTDERVRPIREACRAAGIALDVLGIGAGRVSPTPAAELATYDIVFAKARSALEALAVGAAVVVCDSAGLAGLVTRAELARYRALNFGIRTLRRPLDPDLIRREIDRYDSAEAAEVSRHIRDEAGHEAAVDALMDVYREVLEGPPSTEDAGAEGRAAAAYLRSIADAVKVQGRLRVERDMLAEDVARLQGARAALAAEVAALRGALDEVTSTLTYRVHRQFLRVPGLRSAVRLVGRATRALLPR